RAVTRTAARGEAQPERHLLRGLHRVVARRARLGVGGDVAALVQHHARAREQVEMALDHEARAERAAGLLIGDTEEDYVARERSALAREREQRDRARRAHALVVDRAASPQRAVAHL